MRHWRNHFGILQLVLMNIKDEASIKVSSKSIQRILIEAFKRDATTNEAIVEGKNVKVQRLLLLISLKSKIVTKFSRAVTRHVIVFVHTFIENLY